ncbi:hypothetical protein HCA99_10470 [Listeria booriae]|uniref:hypothetical protein n=1 Tax=Listeria booriae TaxID=1552123 RepID=UPI0016271BAE|nr:hypothetical protein [Listeria booriae]MBC2079635.1 hypothetical protein [Listeria booriae]
MDENMLRYANQKRQMESQADFLRGEIQKLQAKIDCLLEQGYTYKKFSLDYEQMIEKSRWKLSQLQSGSSKKIVKSYIDRMDGLYSGNKRRNLFSSINDLLYRANQEIYRLEILIMEKKQELNTLEISIDNLIFQMRRMEVL